MSIEFRMIRSGYVMFGNSCRNKLKASIAHVSIILSIPPVSDVEDRSKPKHCLFHSNYAVGRAGHTVYIEVASCYRHLELSRVVSRHLRIIPAAREFPNRRKLPYFWCKPSSREQAL